MSDARRFWIWKSFQHQTTVKLPLNASKRERFLKYVRNLRFFERRCFFFEEKCFYFKIAKTDKFAVECVSIDIAS